MWSADAPVFAAMRMPGFWLYQRPIPASSRPEFAIFGALHGHGRGGMN
jgi:hypothetical protein